jgi:hypothetical protein
MIALAPGIGATFYGSLPRDLDTPTGREVIRACDVVTLHTAADSTDVTSAALVRRLGCPRVWLAIPANYLSRLDLARGRVAALDEIRRVARVARDCGAELLELNGEGASDGAVVGDWTSAPRDEQERRRLDELAVELCNAIRATVPALAIGWTSHDGVRSFRVPRAHLGLVDLHAPQHYPAQAGRTVSQRELAARVAWSRGQWEALVAEGRAPAAVAPYGAAWSPYLQGHGHAVGALVWGLCEAPTARLWACPGSWSPEAVEALRLARALRSTGGYGPDAVERWQTAHGLDADGSVGPRTLAALTRAA